MWSPFENNDEVTCTVDEVLVVQGDTFFCNEVVMFEHRIDGKGDSIEQNVKNCLVCLCNSFWVKLRAY